ncbi:MAG: transketolase [bacterium]|nr:transketolase [bacterium]
MVEFNDKDIEKLETKAKDVRRWIIKMLAEAGSGHPGGSLSSTDIITALYFKIMNHKPDDPKWPDRDRFVLSKGHCCPALYAVLSLSGYFPTYELMRLRKIDSPLQGHTDMLSTPGVEISAGSLGQGLSVAGGMALAGKLNHKDYRVYVVFGDGESQEGQVWEAAMACPHYKLDNLCAFLDHNKLQIDGPVSEVMNIAPVTDKFKAFGWHTIEIDGHDMRQIIQAVNEAKNTFGQPTMVIAHTIKGKGVSFMEGKVGWHGVAPTKEKAEKALLELG